MSLKRPVKVGKYDVVDVVGRGGMGVVYKANDPLLGRFVAIKMMTMEDYTNNPEMLQRFYREAKSTGNLHHRNIVTVYELGDQDGSPYLVMEFLEGHTLDSFIRARRPLTLLDRVDYMVEVCEGLTYAHERSVIHRDIKPGNIMVLANGGVKIVDFGIAHIGNRTVTRTGQLLGSLPYMSPEQISGKPVDGRSDIFSLGVVFYQLLTSELPFDGDTPAATLLKIMHDPPRPLTEYNHSYPADLDAILLRVLAKNREQRYATAQEFAFDLLQVRSRIQQEMVDEHLNEAESLLLRGELLKSRDKLLNVLKIDRYNTKAVELSRITQQHLEQQEVGQRVGELRRQAEEAYRHDQYVVALDLIQQALNLHSTDPDLQRLRVTVQQAKTRAERLRRTIERAELAYQQGELDSAKQAVEEALALAPDNAEVKGLNEGIQRDWAQRARRLQVDRLVEEARKEIASRNFTLALKVLRTAEALDPSSPQLKALIDAAQTAREQEQRRKALEAVKHEIESALDRDDFEVACGKAQAAIEEYPDDRGLQKLAELAEKQKSLAERKHFIDEQVIQARKLLEVGRTQEALDVLQSAQEKIGGDPHVESLLGVVRETLERERVEAQKAEYLRRAKDLLRRKEFAECIEVLESAQSELGNNAEIDDLLQFAIEQSEAEKRRQAAEAAAEKARTLIENQEYESAIAALEEALRDAPDEELRLVLVQARHSATDYRKRLEDALANADSMMQGQRPVEALQYLRSQPESFLRDRRIVALSEKAEQQVERLRNIERELEKARVHLRRDEFDQARTVATEGARLYGGTLEFNKLLSEIDERQAQSVAETLEAAMNKARNMVIAGDPEAALDHLALVQTKIVVVPAKLSAAFSSLQQEASNAKAKKARSLAEQLLAAGDHEKATALLETALTEFPQTRELQQVKKSLDQAVQRRSEAQNQISRAEDSFRQGAWRDGAERCLHAAPFASRDPIIRKALLNALENAAERCVEVNWRDAEFLLQCIRRVQPSAVLPSGIAERVEASKQEEAIQECLAEADEFQTHGEFEEALRRVEAELAKYPQEKRLSELKQRLQKLENQAADQIRSDRERQAYLDDVEQRLKVEASPKDRIKILEEALHAYPEEANLTRQLTMQQTLWHTVTSLVDEAHGHERSKRYDDAIQSWEAIGALEVTHPDLRTSLTRLNLSKQELEREIQREKETREKREKLAEILGAAQKLRSAGNLESSLSKIEEGLRAFPGHPQFVQMKAAVESAIREAKERKEKEEQPRQVGANGPERKEDNKRNQASSAKRNGKEKKDRPSDKAKAEGQRPMKEPGLQQLRQVKGGESGLSLVASTKKQAQPEKDQGTKVWRGSPLPVEMAQPAEVAKRPQAVVAASAKKAPEPTTPTPRRAPVKLYAGIAACIVAGVMLASMGWKKTHTPEPSGTTAVQSVSSSPAVSAPVPTAMVRLDLRDGKPGAEVLVDSQSKGKVSRHGTFSVQLPAGDHQIQWTAKNKASGTVTRHFAAETPVQLTAADLVPEKAPEIAKATSTAPTDQTDWERVKDSQSPAQIEQFISRYPNSDFTSQAQTRLESQYWNNAAGSNTVNAYNQYLDRYPQGTHTQQAKDNITELEWRSVENSGDASALDAFVKKHPSGGYHDQAVGKLDDLAWLRTKQSDTSSLRSYLQSFSEGHHSAEAKKRLDELSTVAAATAPTKPASVPPAATDEKKAVLDVLSRYRKAYEGHDVAQLREIWPGMSAQQVKSLGDFFAHASELTLGYRVVGSPTFDADRATVTFEQSLHYVVNGKLGKDSATVTMHLNKARGNPDAWRIDSIR